MNAAISSGTTVGVFDSGVGGLSVLRALLVHLPGARFCYLADSIHCPYGSRARTEIVTLCIGISAYLIEQGAEVIVVACNTASAAALSVLRRTFAGVSFVGMVPAIKPAAALTQTGTVGVLATPATFHGDLYNDVVDRFGRSIRLVSCVCSGLVERIEAGDLDGPFTLALLRSCLQPILDAGADTLVLGCTHYPFVIPAIRQIVGDDLAILEPSDAVARQAARVCGQLGPRLCQAPSGGTLTLLTTGDPVAFGATATRLLAEPVGARGLHWQGSNLRD